MTPTVSILVSGATTPAWAEAAANVIYWTILGALVVGMLVIGVPAWRPVWLVEAGMWLTATAGVVILGLIAALIAEVSPIAGLLAGAALIAYVAYWLPRSHRTTELELNDLIAAPAAEVFALIVDQAAKPRLHPSMESAWTEDGMPVRLGSRIRARVRRGRLEGVVQVVEFDPPWRYADRLLSTPETTVTISLSEAQGGTRITYRSRSVISLPNALLSGYLNRLVARRILRMRKAWMARIRSEVEPKP